MAYLLGIFSSLPRLKGSSPRVSTSYLLRGISSKIYAIGTRDSKSAELEFLASTLQEGSRRADVAIVDVGVKTSDAPISPVDFSSSDVLKHCPMGTSLDDVSALGRAEALSVMTTALEQFLKQHYEEGKIAGVIGLGGSGGTALIAPGLRKLPIGVPKMMVSTVASGQTQPYVGTSDLIMMPSVVDISGSMNAVSRRVLGNAAGALRGMVASQSLTRPGAGAADRPTAGLTMFGVTTPCVTKAQALLEEAGIDTLVFHATGTGGQAMEDLVQAGMIGGVLDLTTTEVADHVVGGVMQCGPHRFEAAIAAKVPLVLSVGALDMVNFGGRATVPEKFADRNLFVHNEQVTLMRTTVDENIAAAKFIAHKMNQSAPEVPVRVLLPEQGVSLLDAPGMAFHDPAADKALFATLENEIVQTPHRQVIRLPHHINDEQFAAKAAEIFLGLLDAEKPAVAAPGTQVSYRAEWGGHFGEGRVEGVLSAGQGWGGEKVE
ncbi:hypothetical protein CYMTET_8000 [Cymbomonas tetramitiformis]|uniref:Uncharacterized protein n=1 Tax=Cymbomonas tetramitiformis TaxID=36881 RepID=A0AAE0GU24_9CHLO|nr:hypothetical protein CYMTET_8000 [Cymbomonas tetramitiformis]